MKLFLALVSLVVAPGVLAQNSTSSGSAVHDECNQVTVRHDSYSQNGFLCDHDGTSFTVNIDGLFWGDTSLNLAFTRIDRTVEDYYFKRRGPKTISKYWSNKDDFHDWGKKSKSRVGKKKVSMQKVQVQNAHCLFFVWYDDVNKGLARESGHGFLCRSDEHPGETAANEILGSISLTEAY